MNTPTIKPTIPVSIPPICTNCFLCALNLKAARVQIDFEIETGKIIGKVIKQ